MDADRAGPVVAIEADYVCSHLESRAVLRFQLREKTTFIVV
jgi:hypothetical protein